MPEPFYSAESFYGQQRALRFEADVRDCEVIGAIPRELNGSYYRAGPDSQYPTLDRDIIINGEGMVSLFRFEDGHVDFRCRYVKTERYKAQDAARRRLYGKYRNPYTDDPAAPRLDRDNTANTYAHYHHGRLFALREDSHPTEMDPDTLETLPTWDFNGALESTSVSAHPKIDPVTGEWWSFSFFAHRRFDGDMMLQVIDKDGKLFRQEDFQAPYPGVAHDFAVTREHVIFPVMPMTVDMERLTKGGDFYAFDPNLPAMWGIMPRSGTTKDIRWFRSPGAFMGHVMNAYTEGSKVHVDCTISGTNAFPFFRDVKGQRTDPMKGIPTVSRVTFDLASNSDVASEVRPFPGAMGEMPRCDDRFQMSRYRYGFMKTRDGIARLDWETGVRSLHPIPDGSAQEPVLVPRSPDSAEGDGFILCVVNRLGKNRADLLVLDANAMEAPPLATIQLPFDQPMAFHGCFAPRTSSGAQRAKAL
ncbi:MAG: carotenoid oxygenase family protein [Hyphomonadaceae bacterium]|nr:carotenoid oxygenase family protein [Hyphomonadaceae bacterium]